MLNLSFSHIVLPWMVDFSCFNGPLLTKWMNGLVDILLNLAKNYFPT